MTIPGLLASIATNMFIAENISFQLQLDFLDCLSTIVCNVHIYVYASPTDPHLAM